MKIRHAGLPLLVAFALVWGFGAFAAPEAGQAGDPPAPVVTPAGPVVTPTATGILVENATVRLGSVTYRVPRAELRGTSLSAAEVSSLLDPASPEPVAVRIARLAAAEIVVPRVTAEQGSGLGRQMTTYRELVLADVRAGRIGSGRVGGATFETAGEAGISRGGFSHFALENFDLASSIALFTDQAGPAPAPLTKLYGSFAIEGVILTDAAGAVTRIARIGGRDLSARPTPEGWAGTMDILGAQPRLAEAGPEERRRAFAAIADLAGGFEVGSLEASGIELQDPNSPDGSARIARLGFAASAGQAGEFQLEGFDAGLEGGRVRIGSIALGGIALKPMLDRLRGMAAGDLDPTEIRRFIPATGTMRISGLAYDPGRQGNDAGASGRIRIGAIEIAADKPVEGLPSEMRLAVSDLDLAIPGGAEDGGLKTLGELGYGKLAGSLGAAMGWNEAGQELVIRELSFRAPDMGSATLAATLGHVSRDVFNPDSTVAAVALVGATAQSLDLVIQNGGLFERAIAREATRQKRRPEDLRREYGVAAALGIPAMLGNSASARTLGAAVARFIAKPGRLAVRAKARDATGIGLADFVAGADPSAILERLDVTATAQ